jgi:hypothetical protein
MEEAHDPILEEICTDESLGNTLTWGEKQITEPIDEVTDIQAIAYDQKRKSIMKRTNKKRRLTLDSSILITIEENMINTEHAKTSELIGTGMAITDATLDRVRRDEKEMTDALKELEHLHHLEKYYQDSTQDSLAQKIKDTYGDVEKGKRGYKVASILNGVVCLACQLIVGKLVRRNRPT